MTVRRINQILNKDFNITKRKMIPKPKLTPRHKTSRLAFAEKYKFWEEEWRKIIFSDEKKFNLDWTEKRKETPRELRQDLLPKIS